MKIPIPQNLRGIDILRRAGYGLVRDRRNPEQSFSRRLGAAGPYPRFHAYINSEFINLHLDQKQVSYIGSAKHSGEYDGEVVEREGKRIQEVITSME